MGWLSLVLEPIFIVAFSLILLSLIFKFKLSRKYYVIITYLILSFYLFVTTPLGANFLVESVEINLVDLNCTKKNIKTIVILGAGVSGKPESYDDVWRLKETSYRRTLSGLKLAESISDSNILVSGGYGGFINEADLMGSLIKKLSYSGKILLERTSHNTYESAIAVASILKKNKIINIWLVTSAIHMKRAIQVFEKQNISYCAYPVDSIYSAPSYPGYLIPQISAANKSTIALHEIVGRLWYSLTGKS